MTSGVIVLLSTMGVSLTAYTSFILIKYPEVTSYSNSWYLEKHKWLFLAFCCSQAFPMMGLTMDDRGFLAGFGLLMVAVAAPYKDKVIGLFHYAGVAMSVICSQLYFYDKIGLAFNINSVLLTALAGIFGGKKRMLFMELAQFVSVIGGLIAVNL